MNRRPIEVMHIAGVCLIDNGAGGALGITYRQLDQLLAAGDEERAELLAGWLTESTEEMP